MKDTRTRTRREQLLANHRQATGPHSVVANTPDSKSGDSGSIPDGIILIDPVSPSKDRPNQFFYQFSPFLIIATPRKERRIYKGYLPGKREITDGGGSSVPKKILTSQHF